MVRVLRSIALALLATCLVAAAGFAAPNAGNYAQDWEDASWAESATDWQGGVVRVASGTNGIVSADSSTGHAEAEAGSYTRNGGYSADWGGGWIERLDIYMDINKSCDTSYWWSLSTAICKSVAGADAHLQDNIFMCAGTGEAGKFMLGGRNTNEGAKNSAWIANYASGQEITLSQSMWLTFEWEYYAEGSLQKSRYNVYDDAGQLLRTLDGPSHDLLDCDGLGNPVGGNRYTWFCDIKDCGGDSWLAVDNSLTSYSAVPEPSSLLALLSGIGVLSGVIRRRK
jgi:hypothetical protein